MKVFAKTLALTLAVAMGLVGLSACSGDTWIAKDNGKEIPVSQYLFNAYNSYNYLNNYISNSQGMGIKDFLDGNPSYVEHFDDEIYKAFETFYVLNKQFAALELSLTGEQKDEWESDYKQYASAMGSRAKLSKYMKLMRINDEATLKDYFASQYRQEAVREYYFGENGKEKKSESELKEQFTSDYVRVKHILIKVDTTDESGAQLSEEDAEKIDADDKKKADDLLAELKAGKKDFETVMMDEDINDDFSGVSANPQGYVVNIDDNTELLSGSAFDADFVEGAAKLEKDGDMSVVKGMHGYHIMKKYDLFEEDTDFFKTYSENMINKAFEAKIDTWIEESKFDYNTTALNKFSIKKLKTLSD